ncbi:MAG: UDP-N-acetylmuramoyl-L-alanyl-D-glutamate--2,6-diaminopimelate ligase [Clostridia bacterium]|nr:UDP-N-acetylmuramoyl-L-alanyl-D-glutamate--2,6-diaminopimelate ligase [Clostridia bacterium]
MKLSKLIDGLNAKYSCEDFDIKTITEDSRKITKDCAFVCISGSRFDGHTAAQQALKDGAAVVIVERDLGLDRQVLVENTRNAYTYMCSQFFSNPHKQLKLIGVTGTNGKTTTTFLIKSILDNLGYKTGMLGTVKNMVGDTEYPARLTTPDAMEMQELFRKMVDEGCEYCIMEVSSMALEQGRVYSMVFDASVYTNLTQDHLDYHITMENYKEAKKILFRQSKKAILNLDDKHALSMADPEKCEIVTYSKDLNTSDYSAKNVRLKNDRISYELVGNSVIDRIEVKIPGVFTVYNSMAAAVCCMSLGISLENICKALLETKGVPGRCEVAQTDTPYTIILDYAHTPDALENIISTIQGFCEGRIITVFGCGGDRDKTKRPLMGKIAAERSDFVVVTSDNPRSEDPMEIIDEIISGIKRKKNVYAIEDRKEAIRKAMSIAKPNDIILLAGKGHETYQVLKTGKIHFDEREAIAEILKEA